MNVRRWFVLVLKVGSLFATFGLAAIAMYGFAVPWQVAEDALPQFRGSHKLLVGFSCESGHVGERSFERQSHTYIVPASWATVEVTKDERGVRTEVQPHGALVVLSVFLLGIVGVWWFFIRGYLARAGDGGRA
jgi:hypothetical protein